MVRKAPAKKRRTDADRLARIRRFLDPWALFMGLSQTWHIDVELETDEDENRLANVTMLHPYPKAVVKFNRKAVDTMSDYDMEVCSVHELLHVLAQEPLLGGLLGQLVNGSNIRTQIENGFHLK